MRRGQQGRCLFILPTRRLLDKHALMRSALADAASGTSPGSVFLTQRVFARDVLDVTSRTVFLDLHVCSSQNPLLCFHFLPPNPPPWRRPDACPSPETQGLLWGRASPPPSLQRALEGGVSSKNGKQARHQLDYRVSRGNREPRPRNHLPTDQAACRGACCLHLTSGLPTDLTHLPIVTRPF